MYETFFIVDSAQWMLCFISITGSVKDGRPIWLKKELLAKLKHKKRSKKREEARLSNLGGT